MRRLRLNLILVAVALLLISEAGHAADITCLPDRSTTCATILIKGEIAVGDGSRFASTLRQHHPSVSAVELWSSGGSIAEALKIGRLIRKAKLGTRAPLGVAHRPGRGFLRIDPTLLLCDDSTCHCASACFLIWAGGLTRGGNVLGVHLPTINSPEFADMPVDQAMTAYRRLLIDVIAYLTEMEVSPRYIAMMTDTASTEIQWLNSTGELITSDVPSVEAWLRASCGALSDAEGGAAIGAMEKWSKGEFVSLRERELLTALLANINCRGNMIDGARAAVKADELK